MATAKKGQTPEKTAPAFQPTRKQALTLPILKLDFDTPVYIRVDSPVYEGKQIETKKGEEQLQPAHLIRCTDLSTGEQHEMIVGTVLQGVFDENFEGDAYVGKCFEIAKHKKEGKRYNTYSVFEIEDPAA